jgi:glucosylceramidase
MKPGVVALVSCAVLLAWLGPGQGMLTNARSTSPAAGELAPAQVWLTTGDASVKLQEQPPISFYPGTGSHSHRVLVDENRQYQQMDGFGASITDSSAWLIYHQISPDQRSALMNSLFSPSSGIGMSYVRIPMGASDFALSMYTYDDMPAGQSDPNLDFFSIDHDRPYIIPVIRQAQGINPQLKLMGSPWSAPAWMKMTKVLTGSVLLSSNYQTYANYFVKFIQAYQAEGIPIHAVTIQNEPYYASPTYPTMFMSWSQQAAFVKGYLGPTFRNAGINTKIFVWDHNWGNFDYGIYILDDKAASPFIAGSAWHCYRGTVDMQGLVHNAHPDKDIYFNECSGGGPGPFAKDLVWDMRTWVIGAIRNWAKTVVLWNLALDENNGPRIGGCDGCRGVVTLRSDGGIDYNVEYYVLGHVGKFVAPGAYRIASDAVGKTVEAVAFLTPDDTLVLIVLNPDDAPTTFDAQWRERYLSYTLPAQSVATFRWANLHSIAGRVTGSNGAPLSGVTIRASNNLSATTSITGAYGFADLVSGAYTLTPSQAGFVFVPLSRTVTLPPDSPGQNFVMLPGPVSITLSLSGAASLPASLVYTDTQGLTTTLEFPAGVVTRTTTVWLTPTLAASGGGFAFTGHAFDLEAFQADAPLPGLILPVTVTIRYSDDDVRVVTDETQLVLSWWTGSEWHDPASSTIRDVAGKMLSVPVCRLGRFGLFGPTHPAYLPIVAHNY